MFPGLNYSSYFLVVPAGGVVALPSGDAASRASKYLKWASDGLSLENAVASVAWGAITGTLASQTDLQSALNLKANLASPTLTGTPAAPTASGGTNTTQIATTAFVQSAVSAAVTGLLELKGNLDCSANPNYPSASAGDTYYVSVAGKVGGASGVTVAVGDAVVCKSDNAGGTEASVGTSWFVLEKNLAGALLSANNLSDIADASSARSNLGLVIGTDVAAFSHNHVAANVTDFSEAVDDRVAALIVAGTGITATYDDGANTLTISSSLSSVPNSPGLISGGVYSAYRSNSALVTLSANRLYLIPFRVDYSGSFVKIGIGVNTSIGGSNARLGIYSNNSGVPGTLLLDAGVITTNTTGDREITISQSLTPGWYWLALVADQAIEINADDSSYICRVMAVDGVGGTVNAPMYYYYAQSYGALPSSHGTFIAQGGTSHVPRVWLRAA